MVLDKEKLGVVCDAKCGREIGNPTVHCPRYLNKQYENMFRLS